jgi:hypothetical protein
MNPAAQQPYPSVQLGVGECFEGGGAGLRAQSGGIADPHQLGGLDTGTVGRQRHDHVGVGGQAVDDAVPGRGADEVDAGIEVAVRPRRHSRDLMPRCQRVPALR